MKKVLRLNGLDCANCAAKIEKDVIDIPGVEEVSVNFALAKMQFQAEKEEMNRIVDEVIRIVHKYEPDVEIEGEKCLS